MLHLKRQQELLTQPVRAQGVELDVALDVPPVESAQPSCPLPVEADAAAAL